VLNIFKVAFQKYAERVNFAARFWNMNHVSQHTLDYLKTIDPAVTLEKEKERRRSFPFRVLESIYRKYGRETYVETRGRKKRTIEDVENIEENEKKKLKVTYDTDSSDDEIITLK